MAWICSLDKFLNNPNVRVVANVDVCLLGEHSVKWGYSKVEGDPPGADLKPFPLDDRLCGIRVAAVKGACAAERPIQSQTALTHHQEKDYMPEFVKVATVKDLPPGESKVVECFGEAIALFNVDGVYYAISDACPHAGGPLSEGYVSGTSVMCPWHGWTFDLKSNGVPPNDGIVRYNVQIEGDDILIQPPE